MGSKQKLRSVRGKRSNTLLTIKEAAQLLAVSEVTLRRWDDAGKFKASRHPINGYRLYRLRDLERLRKAIFDSPRGGAEP